MIGFGNGSENIFIDLLKANGNRWAEFGGSATDHPERYRGNATGKEGVNHNREKHTVGD